MLYKEIIRNFISKEKSLIIAPAGYGKTHTITECVKAIPDSDKVLILTHTHAGIASIKNKMINEKVDNKKFNVETITSYAQKYVKSYCTDTLLLYNLELYLGLELSVELHTNGIALTF